MFFWAVSMTARRAASCDRLSCVARVWLVMFWFSRWPNPSSFSVSARARSEWRLAKTSAMVCMRPVISACARAISERR